MNPGKSFTLLNIMVLAYVLPTNAGSESYASGPLPNIRMKKANSSRNIITIRMGSSGIQAYLCHSKNCNCRTKPLTSVALCESKKFLPQKQSHSNMLSETYHLQRDLLGGSIDKTHRKEIRRELM